MTLVAIFKKSFSFSKMAYCKLKWQQQIEQTINTNQKPKPQTLQQRIVEKASKPLGL